MRHTILLVVCVSASLMAGKGVPTFKLDIFPGTNGAVFYKKKCASCHGEKAKKTPLKGMKVLAGRDASTLARKVRSYRDQDDRVGAYAIYETSLLMKEATHSLSNRHISAIAIYLSELK